MPETSVDKHHGLVLAQNDIWLAGQFQSRDNSKAKPGLMQVASD
jgi:hypothetical protein